MVNAGDQGAYPLFVLNNTLDPGVIQHLSMSEPQPPRLLDQVRQSLRLRHFSLKCDSLAGGWLWHPHRTRVVGPQGCQNHHDLHSRIESRRARSKESPGSGVSQTIKTAPRQAVPLWFRWLPPFMG